MATQELFSNFEFYQLQMFFPIINKIPSFLKGDFLKSDTLVKFANSIRDVVDVSVALRMIINYWITVFYICILCLILELLVIFKLIRINLDTDGHKHKKKKNLIFNFK